MSDRPPIPADIKRKVLVEAGHRCSIPTCRLPFVEVHHIVPWAECHEHKYENLIALCPNCHRMVEEGKIDRKSLREYKKNLRFAHDKFSQLEIDILLQLATSPKGTLLPWTPYQTLMVKRLIDSEYIFVQETDGGVYMYGVKSNPCFLGITEKGMAFFNELNGGEGDQILY